MYRGSPERVSARDDRTIIRNHYFFCIQGCDRNSEEKHALSHNKSNPSHNVVVHLQNWVVW